jgi:hypothetical protein
VPLAGDSQSLTTLLLLRYYSWTCLLFRLSRVRGTRPVFRIPPNICHDREATTYSNHKKKRTGVCTRMIASPHTCTSCLMSMSECYMIYYPSRTEWDKVVLRAWGPWLMNYLPALSYSTYHGCTCVHALLFFNILFFCNCAIMTVVIGLHTRLQIVSYSIFI